MIKFGSASILEILQQNSDNIDQIASDWNFEKKPGRMYLSARSVSVGTNGNGDHFLYDELKKSWGSFIGKGIFVDHRSNEAEARRGTIIDAKFIDNNENSYVVCLMELDEIAHPQICQMIRSGIHTDVSMGTSVAYSECSVCKNKAQKTSEYCNHLKFMKGMTFAGQEIFEINHGLEFIELSLVSKGADEKAKILSIIAKQARINNQDIGELLAFANHNPQYLNTIKESQKQLDLTVIASMKLAKEMRNK